MEVPAVVLISYLNIGDPTPTISLYINGKLIKQQKNRHLTQVVENITREMDIVSCYADNGYGTPMQSARRIQVSRKLLSFLFLPEEKENK